MSVFYGNDKRKSYQERQQARREEDAKKLAEEKAKPPVEPVLDPNFFNSDGSPLSYAERSVLRKAALDGKKESERLAAERQAEREAAIPEHERKRKNVWRETLERRRALDRPGNRQSPQILRDLKKKADEEDKKISNEMADKQRQYKTANDPEIQAAVAYAQKHFEICSPEDKPKWAEVLAIAEEGDKALAWTRARELAEAALQKQMQLQADHDAKMLADLTDRDHIRQTTQRITDDLATIPVENKSE